jgi:hypothetical protein
MKTSDHPAAKPRQYRPPVFRADEEENLAPVSQEAAPGEELRQIEVGMTLSDPLGERDGWVITESTSRPTREPIGTAPQDGSYLRAFWGSDDDTGRLVRWREGRHFNNRRWVTGGTWAPADGMVPLPAEAPTEWLKPAEEPEPDEGEPAEAEEAA